MPASARWSWRRRPCRGLKETPFRPQLRRAGLELPDRPQHRRAGPIRHQHQPAGDSVALTSTGATAFGFDFDPTLDRVRVITDAGENVRLHPATGALASTDTAINPASAVVTAAAYTNNFGQWIAMGSPTTLYTLDATHDRLAIQTGPNEGTQTSFMPVTLGGTPLDFTSVSGFDIPGRVQTTTANGAATGTGYAVLTVGGLTSFYAIELSTGAATALGTVGTGSAQLSGLALGDGVRMPTTTTVTSSPETSPAETLVTVTATVSPAAASGTVTFTLDRNGTPIPGCTARPLTAGTATCQYEFPSAGVFSVGAQYSGDANYATSKAGVTQTVTRIATTTTLTITTLRARLGEVVTLTATVAPATATGTVRFQANGMSLGTVTLAGGQATLTTSTLPLGTYRMSARYDGSPAYQSSTTDATPTLLVGIFQQHFAEGATGFFQTDVGVLNASATTANITVRLFPESAPAFDLRFALDIAGGVSTLIEADQPIAATRQMTWGSPVYGSTLESGVAENATTWYFAEGATGGFSLFYLIENPGATEAPVTFTHLLEGGGAPVVRQEVVPPFSRRTFFVNEVPGVENAALSTVITSSVPIVAERAMYLNTTSRLWEGGTASAGATALSTNWSFAEGATGFFFTYLLLGNPNADDASVTVTYQLPDGTTIDKTYTVDGQSRRTIDVRGEDPQLESTSVGMTIASTRPIVAERAMWWGLPFYEGSVAFGSIETGTTWAIGEAVEGGPNGEAAFVLVSNNASTAGTVRFTVVYDDGTSQQKDFALAGSARLTVRIGTDFPDAQGRTFSVIVESLTTGVPITVEYSRYQSTGGFLDAGGAALATRVK